MHGKIFSLCQKIARVMAIVGFVALSFWGLGYPFIKDTGEWSQTAVGNIIVLSLLLIGLGRLFSRKVFLWVVVPFFILCWIYLPHGMLFGGMSLGIIGSLIESNPAETWEYLRNFPWYIYVLWLAYPFMCYAVVSMVNPSRSSNNILSARVAKIVFAICIVIIGVMAIGKPLRNWYKNRQVEILNPINYAFVGSKFYPSKFLFEVVYYYRAYLVLRDINKKMLDIPADWRVVSSNQKYKNHVLIIGESMRRDYMSVYGYPYPSTPFLNQVNGWVFNNYASAAPNTITSLERTLYKVGNKGEIQYHNNIIALARAANFKIWWLSNQNWGGIWDSAASRLAQQADVQYMATVKNGKSFDTVLLQPLADALKQPSDQPRLLVLHLMGSHPLFCERLENGLTLNNVLPSEDMSCYVESVVQTDRFIEQVHTLLQQAGEPWSVVYFSDHGLSSHRGGGSMSMNTKNKQNYAVPFIRFDSDSQQRVHIAAERSGFDFLNGFASWLGIEEESLSKNPEFYSEQSRGKKLQVYNWQKMVDFDSLQDDPPQIP